MFFEPGTERPLGLPDVHSTYGLGRITSDVIYCPRFVLQGSLVLGVYNLGAQCDCRFVNNIFHNVMLLFVIDLCGARCEESPVSAGQADRERSVSQKPGRVHSRAAHVFFEDILVGH